jgi:transposase
MADQEHVKRVFEALRPVLNERMRRLVAAAQAQALGHGGVTLVAEVTGLARSTITQGMAELTAPPPVVVTGAERLRRPGGGRKRLTDRDPTLLRDLEALVEPATRGDPESPLRWTCKSLSTLAEALGERGHRISGRKVGDLLRDLGYSLQANRKTREGASHPDRNAQFEHINAQALAFQQRGQPVISVDTKKKELVGAFKNSGREWQPKGQPELVQVHDFPSQALGKAIPYGVYDVGANEGWVSVGTDHDTAEFAVATVRRWWQQMGAPKYPDATELLIMADGGGSNGNRSRLWKVALQQCADETGLRLSVCHFPPGTSKWNKIEHRMFSHITQNWRGRPLVSHEVVVNLIGSTTTRAGLQIRAALDSALYPTKKQVSDDEVAAVQISLDSFHGEWNYSIHPRTTAN